MGAATHVGTFDAGSPEWHAARAHGIGGSEIAAVLGLSPFESRFSLWHRKGGQIGPVEETPEMEWGKRLERAVAEKWDDEHAESVHWWPGTYARDGWMIGNPDGITYRHQDGGAVPGEVFEIKTSPFGDGWGPAGTDELPVHVRIQVLWYCGVLDCTAANVAVLIGGHDYREYRIEFDQDEFDLLAEAGAEFMATLERNERPDIDEHSATFQALREMHPDIDGTEHELSNAVARRYLIARQQSAKAAELEQYAKSLVADEMGSAHKAVWDGQVIARRQARGEGLPYLVAARNLPTIEITEAAA
jgi:putative phage-type endonuclease